MYLTLLWERSLKVKQGQSKKGKNAFSQQYVVSVNIACSLESVQTQT